MDDIEQFPPSGCLSVTLWNCTETAKHILSPIILVVGQLTVITIFGQGASLTGPQKLEQYEICSILSCCRCKGPILEMVQDSYSSGLSKNRMSCSSGGHFCQSYYMTKAGVSLNWHQRRQTSWVLRREGWSACCICLPWRSILHRVGFLPAKTCFCHTWGLNQFKLAETWFKPAITVKCSYDNFFWYTCLLKFAPNYI